MPRQRTSAARERILQTASDLFYSQGLRAVGVDTVVEKSGVAKMTLYNHFPGKDELVREVLERKNETWLKSLRAGVERLSPDPAGRLLAVFDVLEEWYKEPAFRGCIFINAALETPSREHTTSKACLNHKRRLREFLGELARLARVKDPETVADQVYLLAEGATVAAAMWGIAEPARKARKAAASLMK